MQALTVGDLNGDGSSDMVVGYDSGALVALYNTGKGDAGFTRVPFGDNQGVPYGIALADFDRDGYPGIGVARTDAPNVLYFGP